MAISLKHSFNCAKSDGLDATAVKPSDWNAEHSLTAASGKVLGTLVGSTTVSELPITVDATGQSMTPPSGSTASRPVSPSGGMIRYNTTTAQLEAYVGATWREVAGEAFPSGTRMLFQQTSAPTGWTKDTSQDNKALRVVSGAAGSGGSVGFTTAFSNQNTGSTQASGTVAGHQLSLAEIPSHRHYLFNGGDPSSITTLTSTNTGTWSGSFGGNNSYTISGSGTAADRGMSSLSGSNGSHSHGFTGDWHAHSINLAVQYVDVIIATKN